MAATLAEIKSRVMLPITEEDEDEEDPKLALIARLQEYQRYKTASENIAMLPLVDRDFFKKVSINQRKHSNVFRRCFVSLILLKSCN